MIRESLKYHRSGQTLVEAVVVIGVVVLLATGLIAGTTSSLRSARSGKTRSQAVKLATEGIEQMRALRDANWAAFAANAGKNCFGSDFVLNPASGVSCPVNITTAEGSFTRAVTFDLQATRMVVTVDVDYEDGENTRTVTLITHFTRWK